MNAILRLVLISLVSMSAAQSAAELTWSRHTASLAAEAGASEILVAYEFINNGEKPVSITEISTGCDCTTAKSEKQNYEPKEAGSIQVTFKVGDRVGKQEKTIRVRTDDPSNPVVLLTLNVTIPKIWSIEPRYVFWKPGDDPSAKEIRINIEGERSLKLNGVEVIEGNVRCELREKDHGRKYTVIITPTDPKVPTRARIRVLPADPEIQVPLLYASVLSDNSPRQVAVPSTQTSK